MRLVEIVHDHTPVHNAHCQCKSSKLQEKLFTYHAAFELHIGMRRRINSLGI
jgi:hypothetical protein